MKRILVLICLMLCMVLLVCSCGGNTDTDTSKDTTSDTTSDTNSDTNTDTNSDTNTDTSADSNVDNTPDDSGIDLNDGKYRVFVCDENGNGIAGAFVQFCKDDLCDFGETDGAGYLEIPSNEYHIALVQDQSGVYPQITYDETNYPVFEDGSTLITIQLTK